MCTVGMLLVQCSPFFATAVRVHTLDALGAPRPSFGFTRPSCNTERLICNNLCVRIPVSQLEQSTYSSAIVCAEHFDPATHFSVLCKITKGYSHCSTCIDHYLGFEWMSVTDNCLMHVFFTIWEKAGLPEETPRQKQGEHKTLEMEPATFSL